MKSIPMDCPECATTMRLDPGFAGGVCRCSNCGTLMTVPASGAGQAKRLDRPTTPRRETPNSRPGKPPQASDAAPRGSASIPVRKSASAGGMKPKSRSTPQPDAGRKSHAAPKTTSAGRPATAKPTSKPTHTAKKNANPTPRSPAVLMLAASVALLLLALAAWWLMFYNRL